MSRWLCMALLCLPAVAAAEVLDKLPSPASFWALGLVAGAACFVAGRHRRWLGLIVAVPFALVFASLFLELHAPDLVPAIAAEAGNSYLLQSYLSCVLFVCGLLLGRLR